MKHKILITALAAIGLSLSGASHALLLLKPDGTKTQALVVGNKLMLQDAKGKQWDRVKIGTYPTEDGKPIIVSSDSTRSYAPSHFGLELGTDNKAKTGVIAPMNQGPDKLLPAVQPTPPGMGSAAATRGGLPMQTDKQGNEVAPGYKASTLGGGRRTTTPIPQGTQSRASSKSPPKDASGPEGSSSPKQ